MAMAANFSNDQHEMREILRSTSISSVFERVTHGSPNGIQTGRGRLVHCPLPGHNDNEPSCSLSEEKGTFNLFCCSLPNGKTGGGILDLIVAAGESPNRGQALKWLKDSGIPGRRFDVASSQQLKSNRISTREPLLNQKVTGTYDYTDDAGDLLVRVERVEGTYSTGKRGKTFKQSHVHFGPDDYCHSCTTLLNALRADSGDKDFIRSSVMRSLKVDAKEANALLADHSLAAPPHHGEMRPKTLGIPRYPYKVVEVQAAAAAGLPIFFVEGEKKVEALRAMGITATCNLSGANFEIPDSWAQKYFKGAKMVVDMNDCDAPGRLASIKRIGMFRRNGVAAVSFDLGLNRWDKYDVADWNDDRDNLTPTEKLEDLRIFFAASQKLAKTNRVLIFQDSEVPSLPGVPYDFANIKTAADLMAKNKYVSFYLGKKLPSNFEVIKPIIDVAIKTGTPVFTEDLRDDVRSYYLTAIAPPKPPAISLPKLAAV